jgi:hypothetical protein
MQNAPQAGGALRKTTEQEGLDRSLPSATDWTAPMRRRGRVRRETLRTIDQAACLDCGQQWVTPAPFLDATKHVRGSGHRVVVATARVWQYSPDDAGSGGAR